MKRILAAGDTHVGQVRDGNEDSFVVAESVFAVADGMGGHLAGEVASEAALEPVRALDGRVFPDADAAVTALRDAVVTANRTVSGMAHDEPTYRGMGTTLTAALLEGRRLHLAHVGDSRAYLLRDGQLRQLTDDHTLVQHLVDEGQISREQAATHPQRSVITRAIGVGPEIEVDTMSLDLATHDVLLLCSDGLTGVVDDDELAEVLASGDHPEQVVARLIERANDGGGPDNITVVVLRYDPDAADGQTQASRKAHPTITISSRVDRDDSDWAGRLGSVGTPGLDLAEPDTEPGTVKTARAMRRLTATLIGLGVLVAIAAGVAGFLLSQQYFVGLDGEQLVVYRGADTAVGPVQLSWIVERSEVTVDEVQDWYVPSLQSGIPAINLADARRIIDSAPLSALEAEEPEDDLVDDPEEDPEADPDGPDADPAPDAGQDESEDLPG